MRKIAAYWLDPCVSKTLLLLREHRETIGQLGKAHTWADFSSRCFGSILIGWLFRSAAMGKYKGAVCHRAPNKMNINTWRCGDDNGAALGRKSCARPREGWLPPELRLDVGKIQILVHRHHFDSPKARWLAALASPSYSPN